MKKKMKKKTETIRDMTEREMMDFGKAAAPAVAWLRKRGLKKDYILATAKGAEYLIMGHGIRVVAEEFK